jgi:hypothetical protein
MKKSWILHQNNASAHNALAVKQFLADKCISLLDHPRLFIGFSPLRRLPVPQTEKCVKRTRFQSIGEAKKKKQKKRRTC